MMSVEERAQESPRTALSTQTEPISTKHSEYEVVTKTSLFKHVLHHNTIQYNPIQSNTIKAMSKIKTVAGLAV